MHSLDKLFVSLNRECWLHIINEKNERDDWICGGYTFFVVTYFVEKRLDAELVRLKTFLMFALH